jgi:peptidoglycan/LPS O-acetylase OafA/YrhL
LNVQSPRFPLFDSLRAIAALSIVGFHVALVPGGIAQHHTAALYLGQLNIGVSVFFLISGFLLYRPFVAARFEGRPRPPLVPYAVRRFFRIVPAYWVALPIVAVALDKSRILHDPLPYFGFAQVYSRSTLVSGYGPAWTLCVEVTFYALLPLWAFALRRAPGRSARALVTSEAVALAAVLGGAIAWNAVQTPERIGFIPITPAIASLPAFLDHFALGMALAVASVALIGRERQPAAVEVVNRRSWLPWLVALAGYVVLCRLGPLNDPGHEILRHELRALIALCLLLPAVFGDDRGGAVRRLLADRRLQWIGLISYSLYLWHAVIVAKLADHGWVDRLGNAGFVPLAAAASVAVAALSFYAVERQGLRIGRRLAGRRGYQEVQTPPPGSVDRPGAPAIELAGSERTRT